MLIGSAQCLAHRAARNLSADTIGSNWTGGRKSRYQPPMSIIATIMNTATGQPIQKLTFGRLPKVWSKFNLQTGELVTAERVEVGKPAPGKFMAPVSIWVTSKAQD